ncbi:single-stranded DNA-binding protein [Brachybacterium sp. AOP25-B2-12]|uniref:single-stranded DNA-binding protein n=1 Tax=Brachybacterium sp. AOP25-B2-12 TaxID=3457710 RepID=UPI00403404BE
MRDLRTTITGNVAKDVTEHRYDDGTVTAVIRLASTSRYFDQDRNDFTDRKTEFFTVYARRALARNVIDSVRKGDPLIVSGRLGSAEWVKDGVSGFSMTVQAESIGHDLTFGTDTFARSSRRTATPLVDERTGEILGEDGTEDEAPDAEGADASRREPALAGDSPF